MIATLARVLDTNLDGWSVLDLCIRRLKEAYIINLRFTIPEEKASVVTHAYFGIDR